MNSDNFGLTISTKMAKVMHKLAQAGKPYVEPKSTIKRQRLKVVEMFTDLSTTLYKSIVMDDEVNIRLAKASAAFGQLNRNV